MAQGPAARAPLDEELPVAGAFEEEAVVVGQSRTRAPGPGGTAIVATLVSWAGRGAGGRCGGGRLGGGRRGAILGPRRPELEDPEPHGRHQVASLVPVLESGGDEVPHP